MRYPRPGKTDKHDLRRRYRSPTLAYARLLKNPHRESHVRITNMLSGRGHGSEMMRQALARCFAEPEVTAVVVDPLAENLRSHRIYARLGFHAVERQMFGDDTLVMRLERRAWETR